MWITSAPASPLSLSRILSLAYSLSLSLALIFNHSHIVWKREERSHISPFSHSSFNQRLSKVVCVRHCSHMCIPCVLEPRLWTAYKMATKHERGVWNHSLLNHKWMCDEHLRLKTLSCHISIHFHKGAIHLVLLLMNMVCEPCHLTLACR